MSLDCRRKPEYPERTHACIGRTCKLHTERPPARGFFAWTQDFLLQGNSATNCATLHPFFKGDFQNKCLTTKILKTFTPTDIKRDIILVTTSRLTDNSRMFWMDDVPPEMSSAIRWPLLQLGAISSALRVVLLVHTHLFIWPLLFFTFAIM
ncbi:hypothetical protein ATANTOWER_020984 [Ataeniobius toweri]|uniref:Uncharacterized protein n=1 Tax=Ataeniobius toweri TaxID=208326 RepID=A0ABU7BQT6_9TELE|nr:hypothetical protein [Ataeniobius toweri]